MREQISITIDPRHHALILRRAKEECSGNVSEAVGLFVESSYDPSARLRRAMLIELLELKKVAGILRANERSPQNGRHHEMVGVLLVKIEEILERVTAG